MPFAGNANIYPADYLHYWWQHYEDGDKFLNSRFFQSKQQILSRQLKNAKQRQKKFVKSVSSQTGTSLSALDNFYAQLERNPNMLAGDKQLQDVLTPKSTAPTNLEEALGVLNDKDDAWVSQINKGAQLLYQAAQKIVSPNMIINFGEAIIDDYIAKSIEAGEFTAGTSRSQAAKKIILDFRNSQTDGKMFDVPQRIEQGNYNGIDNLNRAEREILALLASVNIIAQSGDVPKDWSGIFTSWTNQCKGLVQRVSNQLYRTAASMAILDASMKFFEKDDQFEGQFGIKSIKGKNININRNFVQSAAWKDLKNRAKASQKGILRKRNQSDSELTVTRDNIEYSFLRATYFKEVIPRPADPLGNNVASLVLRQNLSFTNFLTREMSMRSDEFHGLIQLLVARARAGVDLSGYWETFKENVAYNGFLSALAGYANKEQSQFVVIRDKIFSVADIIDKARTGDITPFTTLTPNYNRSDFLAKSSWVGKIGPNTVAAVERSEIAWNNTSLMLSSMILSIKMDISKNFISSIL